MLSVGWLPSKRVVSGFPVHAQSTNSTSLDKFGITLFLSDAYGAVDRSADSMTCRVEYVQDRDVNARKNSVALEGAVTSAVNGMVIYERFILRVRLVVPCEHITLLELRGFVCCSSPRVFQVYLYHFNSNAHLSL
jgi:hypothetical protein